MLPRGTVQPVSPFPQVGRKVGCWFPENGSCPGSESSSETLSFRVPSLASIPLAWVPLGKITPTVRFPLKRACGRAQRGLGVLRTDHPQRHHPFTSPQGPHYLVCDGGGWKPVVDKHLGEPHFQLRLHGNHPSWKSSQKSSQPQRRDDLPIFSIYLTDTL